MSEAARAGLAEAPVVGVPRHRLSTRIWHWVNALAFFVMLMSGLMIFNAHPRLYWGEYGANYDPAWLQIGVEEGRGYLRVGEARIDTTGLLGTRTVEGRAQNRAFPGWATIPSSYDLALARRWHLTFAWVFALGLVGYGVWSLGNGHLRRDIVPGAAEIAPGHLWADVKRHVRLDFPKDEAGRYNVLQKLTYLGVLLGLIPLMILTGLTMSPSMDATWPWLLDLFGGRQTARSIHFIAAWALVGFLVIHLVMLLLTGPLGKIRAMIVGKG